MSTLARFLIVVLASCSPTASPTVTAPRAPATELDANAAYDRKAYAMCGELFATLAADRATSPDKQRDAAYNAACCYAQDGKRDLAFGLLERAVAFGMRDKLHIETDTDLAGIHDDARWPRVMAAVDGQIVKYEASLKAPALRRELFAMRDADQKARFAWIANHDDKLLDAMNALDEQHTQRMKEIVVQYGWPGKSAVGEDGANAAWLLVQHADRDPAFQKLVLAKMEPMAKAGEVSAVDVAYLYDRVAVAEHREQRFGTQFKDGEPNPIEDEAHVDARRAAIGLPSMAKYREQMRKMYGPKQ